MSLLIGVPALILVLLHWWCRAYLTARWNRDFLGCWVELVQVGHTEIVAGVPVYRTLGFDRVRWIVDPHSETKGGRVECQRLDEAVDALLRRTH